MKTPVLLISLALVSCAPLSHVRQLRESQASAQLSLADEADLPDIDPDAPVHRDTLVVEDPEGNKMILMRAVKDVNGEMVAHDYLDAARVTARFRNVAERGGRVDLRFQILVPRQMQDSRWQVRLYPDLFVLEDSVRLETVLITGSAYRKAQLKGYQQYQRFLDSISEDSLHFVDGFQMENFLRRSTYGVSAGEAMAHFTNDFIVQRNLRKIGRKDRMKAKYVKSPIVTEGLRLDSVIVRPGGDICYDYVQPLWVRRGMRKASVVLGGAIYQEDKPVYRIPNAQPLTFYISSLSALSDPSVKYKTLIVERRVQANTACYIEFDKGRDVVDERLGENASEIARIKSNLRGLMESGEYDMDSIVVTASCSPEGAWASNKKLSQRRSKAVCDYFGEYVGKAVSFLPRSDAENWRMLDALVAGDGKIGPSDKERYALLGKNPNLDSREESMRSMASYKYIREVLYPRLRVVKFDFHLSRRGVLKDTIHTTVVDSVYMAGVEAIHDRDYEKALNVLRPYKDYNTAVAYTALDYNASAMDILSKLEETDNVLYLKALVYSRTGREKEAVESYLKACRLNPSMVHRGNLDPEISSLIKKYDIRYE